MDWIDIKEQRPNILEVRIKLLDSSEIECWTQLDGDFYTKATGYEIFISQDMVTHWKHSLL